MSNALNDVKRIAKGTITIPAAGAGVIREAAGVTLGIGNVVYGIADLISIPFRFLLGLVGGGMEPRRYKRIVNKSPVVVTKKRTRRNY